MNTARAARYSAVEHLARNDYFGRDWREFSMAMFTANFDASGLAGDTSPGASFFVSGFVSTVDKWMVFEEEWLSLLREFGIKSPFHMTDFEAGVQQYASWKRDLPRRNEFLARAVDIMHKRTNKPFSHGVILADLRRMFTEFDIPDIVPPEPYAFCGLQVIGYTLQWASNRFKAKTMSRADTMEVVFEDGDMDKGKFLNATKRRYGKMPVFKTKSWVPFQICDLLAWEHRRRVVEFAKHGAARSRASYAELERRLPDGALRFDNWQSLERFCISAGFARRA